MPPRARKGKPTAEDDVASMTYEQAVEALEGLIDRIEQGSIGLQESIAEYKRGSALIKRCREILESAEQEIAILEARDREGQEPGDMAPPSTLPTPPPPPRERGPAER